MIVIISITALLVLLYLLYPVWLMLSSSEADKGIKTNDISGVSLILLSFNGKEYLKEKIEFLLKELAGFQNYELIIIDDCSNDGSQEILSEFEERNKIKIICKSKRMGIPHSMNIGVENAKYEYLIFCDQRQMLSNAILQHIVEPLKFSNVGAVSACISHIDKENKSSIIRKHENFLKAKESNTGNLIGVYGPFYAIKKQCYTCIPRHIILDDLYLSLKILKTKQIILREDCRITDESITVLYDYQRTTRYLRGFLQILKDKTIKSDLNARQKLMLIWHKYLRLLIPFFVFLSYLSVGFKIMNGVEYVISFCILTGIGLLSLMPLKLNNYIRLMNLVRMTILYFIGSIDVFINKVFLRRQIVTEPDIHLEVPENIIGK